LSAAPFHSVIVASHTATKDPLSSFFKTKREIVEAVDNSTAFTDAFLAMKMMDTFKEATAKSLAEVKARQFLSSASIAGHNF
jgi:hypothetical protein